MDEMSDLESLEGRVAGEELGTLETTCNDMSDTNSI